MSVINKVLQDLDQRQAVNPGASVAGAAQSDSRLRRGTRSLASRMARFKFQAKPGQRRWLWWLALLPLLAAVAAGTWFVGGKGIGIGQQQQAQTLPDAPQLPVLPTLPVSASPVVVAPPVPEPVPAPTPVPEPVPTPAPAPAWEGLRMDSRLSANYVANTPPSDKAARPVEAAKPAQSPKTPASSSTSSDSAPPPRRQQATSSDALAQAQSQWNAGLRAEAIALMEKTLAAAERHTNANTQPGHADAALLVLVRELTRMHVAQGQFGAVWELLVRLEPLLGDQPDLWAIRANAAQRLGRHQDSVHAYMVALQSHPEEPRWLLGAAVSLAASGKTDSAAEMAEKARAHGSVSKDVLAYLRQLGVPLKD